MENETEDSTTRSVRQLRESLKQLDIHFADVVAFMKRWNEYQWRKGEAENGLAIYKSEYPEIFKGIPYGN